MHKFKKKTIIIEKYKDGVPLDESLLLKLLEQAKDPSITDTNLHNWVSRMSTLADGDVLDMADYQYIITEPATNGTSANSTK